MDKRVFKKLFPVVILSENKAWKYIMDNIGVGFCLDRAASDRAGYKVYRDENKNYICDLGDRLEVNVGSLSGNIWREKNYFVDKWL